METTLTLDTLLAAVAKAEAAARALKATAATLQASWNEVVELGCGDLGLDVALAKVQAALARIDDEREVAKRWYDYGAARVDALARAWVDDICRGGRAVQAPADLVAIAPLVGDSASACPFDALAADEAEFMDEALPHLGGPDEAEVVRKARPWLMRAKAA